ncbi:MAG: LTA synthase family protein [Blautia sp.]|nr:LTA synthase family protein [Blautia sp.]
MKKLMHYLLRCFLFILITAAEYLQLQYSSVPYIREVFRTDVRYLAVNLLIIASVNLLLAVILQSMTISVAVSSVLFTLWAVANYFVIEYHGSPLFPSEFVNAGAAVDVSSGYSLHMNRTILYLLLVFAAEVILVVLLHLLFRGTGIFHLSRLLVRLLLLCACVLGCWLCLYSPYKIKKKTAITFSWSDGIKGFGFGICAVEDAEMALFPYKMPEGYSVQAVPEEPEAKAGRIPADQYPDVILILNETFCDLDIYTDLQPDKDYLADFYGIDNAVYGHAITPREGGGTNNSEYELLTANSLYLIRNSAPFNFVDFSKADNHAVTYFHQLGYDTYAMHYGVPGTYSRNKAYKDMGFDHITLGKDSFSYHGKNGNRSCLDSDNYHDLTDQYEAGGDAPRFMYLLTLQNHVGWEQNEDSLDTVHTGVDFGDLTDDINEYMSTIELSAHAFRKLTEYFETVDRPVIVCMVGDHAPSFIKDLPCGQDYTEEEAAMARRTVPYVIWSNRKLSYPENTGYASMTDLLPLIAESAGLPESAYYRMILTLRDTLPVRTSYGRYRTTEGEIGIFKKSSPYYDLLQKYYYLEYNGLRAGNDYLRDAFLPPVG